MDRNNQVQDTKRDNVNEFNEEYYKDFEIPTSKCLKRIAHPTEWDQFIIVNKVNFPNVKPEKVTAFIHKEQLKGLKGDIKNHKGITH